MRDESKTKGELLTELRTQRQRLIRFKQEQNKLKFSLTERKRAEDIMQARLRLLKIAESQSLEDFTQATLDESEALTASRIGFYHLVEADQRTLALQTWSTNTLRHMCTAGGGGQHYSVAEAGVWVDCVLQRRPVIHNNYDALPHRKGMPPGHAPVVRELVVPIFRDDKIVAIIGVGNKPSDYDEWDIEAVSLLGDLSWDITQRKRAEREILRLASFPQMNPQPVLELDTNGRVTYYNEAALAALGKMGKAEDLRNFLPGDLREILVTAKQGGERRFQREVVVKDTVFLTNIYFIEPFDAVRLYAVDITSRKQAEAALRRLNEELEQRVEERTEELRETVAQLEEEMRDRQLAEQELAKLNEELEQRVKERTAELKFANREMEAFSYSVSHDLKAPVRAIQGFSKMLLTEHAGKLDAEALRLLQVITTNTELMHHLIDDLLALSRLGRLQIRKSAINLTGISQKVFEKLRSQAPGRDLQLTLSDLPPGWGDQSLLYQVMENLLANAVKFTKSRKTAVIEVGGRTEGKENIYYVRDNGAGFDERYVQNLFRPFQRLHSSEEYEGTGVGLAIVQRIIQRHGGRVWAEGKVGEGATFYFALLKNAD